MKMLKKIKSMIPVIALVVMVLGSCYLSALDEKKDRSTGRCRERSNNQ